MSVRQVLVVLGLLAVLLTGCERVTPSGGDHPRAVQPVWRPLTLPVPPGAPGRPLLRDAAACAGRWYVVGGVADPAGATRPAVWSSVDGAIWSVSRLVPSTFYGRQHLLYAAACRDGRLAALGTASGGVHGNPRIGSWVEGADGVVREVAAPFERFGGPRAVSAARLVAGPSGWLIVGSRVDGAAVWASTDGREFTLRAGLPELAGDGRGRTAAYDGLATGSGWLVVGAVLPAGGTGLAPLAWTSRDGLGWRRAELPTASGRGQAQRVVSVGGAVVAVGPAGDRFAAWRGVVDPVADGAATRWREAGGFPAAGPGVATVSGLVAVGSGLLAVARAGAGQVLWYSDDLGGSWRSVRMPVVVADTGETAVAVAAQGERLLLIADDGRGPRVWWTPVSGFAADEGDKSLPSTWN
ncbi:hypothetical protein [Micromonospora sp. WP24]|uniref:hypothetical protein n=1 Tax=Micromonospora sp. WP24 TaxID=2604469 RepID=UPI001CA339AE|nr:hypothetical protein [Micromonospora sp. WP24]